jgi:acetylornithine/N-succinyldiaminopimelate aminotransferase
MKRYESISPALNPQHLMWITERPPIVFESGEGSWLVDQHGKRYLDFLQGWAVNCLGHSHPVILQAIERQAKQLLNPSPAFFNRPSIDLATRLCELSCFDRVFFANSGAEANEGAIKLARKWGQKNKNGAFEIITFVNGFHGRTLATMSASGKPGWDKLFAPQVPGFKHAQLNDIESVNALINDQTVAVMLEPVQGEAGVIPTTNEFLIALRQLTKEHHLLLITDEVQSGMARTGKLFAHQHAGIEPDIMTLGKGIGGGVPLSALLAKEPVCMFEAGDQGGTYNGNPLMTAVGLAVLDHVCTPDFLKHVQDMGAYLSQQLQTALKHHGLIEERGQGLLRAAVFDKDITANLVLKARDLNPIGLLINAPRPNTLRFMPSLTITKTEIDQMIELLLVCF